jgi:SpoVK/Ycf46/Vps4 family AAA+-type ATPase
VNTLLQSLDTRKDLGFTIAVTNHESLLDPAIWRRFDIQIEIPNPPLEVLKELISKFMHPLKFNEQEIKFLSWCMEGGSGADTRALVQWLKKSSVLHEGDKIDLVASVKQFSLLNSGRIDSYKRDLLSNSEEDLINNLLHENRYNFKQKDIAALMGLTPSTLSKKLAKHKDNESEVTYA